MILDGAMEQDRKLTVLSGEIKGPKGILFRKDSKTFIGRLPPIC